MPPCDKRVSPSERAATRRPIFARFAGCCIAGRARERNQDNFLVANLESGERHPRGVAGSARVSGAGLSFTVCDGMGGAVAGEVASRMAVDILYAAMLRGGPPGTCDALARRLVGAIEAAGNLIFEAARHETSLRGMGTTVTAAALIDHTLLVAEVGDSRAYLLRQGQLKQITKDQSLVSRLIEAGRLTEAEAESSPVSHVILQALGTAEKVQVDLTFVELRAGDRLLLCSDGLHGPVRANAIRETLAGIANPAACSAQLVQQAGSAGGNDDTTAVVVDFHGPGLDRPKETDSFGYARYPLPVVWGDPHRRLVAS
jgi:protein phosphatase